MVYAKREKETTLHDRCIMLSLASEVGIYRAKFQSYINDERVHARVKTCLETVSSFREVASNKQRNNKAVLPHPI